MSVLTQVNVRFVTLRGDATGAVTFSVTVIAFTGAGLFVRLMVVVALPPAANALQPAAGVTVKVDATVPAEAALAAPTVAQAAVDEESIVKGVPPVAADVTETVWAGPG